MNKEMIEAAQMYALGCISIEDVCYLLKCEEKDLPSSFYSYAELFGKKYDIDLQLKEIAGKSFVASFHANTIEE